jgi:hypothetical protein
MAKNEHSWFARLTQTIPNTAPPPSKKEIRDIVEASRGQGGFKNMSNKEIVKWAKGKHRNYEGIGGGNQFGGVDVYTESNIPGRVRIVHYDNLGNKVGTSEKGR